MKKKVNSINNNYFLGGFIQDQFSDMKNNLGNSIMNTVSGVSNTVSGLLSSGNAKTDAITSGIASGLQTVGSAFGPIGSAAGAIAGALTKGVGAIIGSKGSVNTDTGEMTKGRGILGSINRDELEAQYRRVNQGISDQKQTALMQQEWAQEHGDNDFSLAAEGGIIPTTLAYLDDGELGRTPDGQLFEIPEEGKPTDSNLVKVPVGTQILSDKIKVPGTNKTFAERGKEIMKTNKYKGNDKYAENSKKLNERNAQIAYDNLLTLQESVKKNKKIKNNTNKYYTGTNGIADNRNAFMRFKDNMQSYVLNDTRKRYLNMPDSDVEVFNGKIIKPKQNALQYNKPQYYAERNLSLFDDGAAIESGLTRAGWSHGNNQSNTFDYVPELNFDFMNKKTGNKSNVNKKSTTTKGNTNTKQTVTPKFDPISKTTPSFAQSMPDMGKITDIQKQNWYNASKAINNPDSSKSTNNFDFSDLLGDLAGLVGPISNIASATPEKARVFTYTPQFAPTEYDITPMLREIDLSNAITRYNINRAGGAGTGANLAQAIQGQVARDRSIAQAYNMKNNIENERRARNTGIYNDWARYNTEAFHRGYVEDAQNRAAADQIRRTGIRDLSTALQTMSRDRRLAKRDQATLAAMEPFLQYGMTREQYQKLISLLS